MGEDEKLVGEDGKLVGEDGKLVLEDGKLVLDVAVLSPMWERQDGKGPGWSPWRRDCFGKMESGVISEEAG
jgi:hypothetical protein